MPQLQTYRYRVVDVFTQNPLEGNPLAVFPDASGIEDHLMQKIARELNLSETVFVQSTMRPDCAARIRIFTPARELIFAGHPTVGAAFVLLDEGLIPPDTSHFSLEEGVGPVPVHVEKNDPPLIWLRTPPIEHGKCYDRGLCAQAISLEPADLLPIDPQLVTAGNPSIFIPLKDKETVDRSALDAQRWNVLTRGESTPVCAFIFSPTPAGAYSRMFAPELGVVEDPATGSATGPLASYMVQHGLVASNLGRDFVSEQGTKMGRRSLLHIHLLGENGSAGIEVGGCVTPVIEGVLKLSSGT